MTASKSRFSVPALIGTVLILLVLVLGGLYFYRASHSTGVGGEAMLQISGKKAFELVRYQVNLGPRNPGSEAHRKVGDWIAFQAGAYGWQVIEQKAEVEHPLWKKKVAIRNIIARLNPERGERVLLTAHYDTRPFAENDPYKKNQPILGANDGASGVAVLLELARVMKNFPPRVGVDLVFWDFEDTGEPREIESYCLGSKYWAQNPHVPNYSALFAINLDMVGGFGAQFPREGHSEESAPFVYDHLEKVAETLGYAKYFPNRRTGRIFDDHLNIIRYRAIPTVDLIHVDASHQFFSGWHTQQDRLEAISYETLGAVSKVVAETVYEAQKSE